MSVAVMTEASSDSEESGAWAVRRIRAVMLKTLPDMPGALCKGRSTAEDDPWIPDRSTPAQEREAKQICRACPAMISCLSYALRCHRLPGIWGGTNERERDQLMDSAARRLFGSQHQDTD